MLCGVWCFSQIIVLSAECCAVCMVFKSSDLCDQLNVVCMVFQSSDLCDQVNVMQCVVFQSSDLCDQLTVLCMVFQSSDLCDQLNSAELVCLREVLPVSVGTTVECMAYQVRGFHPPCARGDSKGILNEGRKIYIWCRKTSMQNLACSQHHMHEVRTVTIREIKSKA